MIRIVLLMTMLSSVSITSAIEYAKPLKSSVGYIICEEDTNDIEYWRALGYNNRVEGNYKESLKFYSKVLEIDNLDYDAKLAIARLYFIIEDYSSSLIYYNKIFQYDSTDVEALLGFGRCNFRMEKFSSSANYFEKAIYFLPDYFPAYFDLARAYIAENDLKAAITTYEKLNDIDPTFAESWAGIGKMYYWMGFPFLAVENYRRAILLDTANKEIIDQYERVKKETDYNVSAVFKSINEKEESYEINAFVQTYGVNKRINDRFSISLNVLLDNSDRDFTYSKDENRWFDNTYARITYISQYNRISAFAGMSNSDGGLTSYGMSWQSIFRIEKIKINNSLTAAYDYFYYWNEVGQDYISDFIRITYKRLTIDGLIRYAIVRDNYVWDFETLDINHHSLISFSGRYKFFKNPSVTLGYNYNYRTYENQSPLYYTPFERHLSSYSAAGYYAYKKFYSYISYQFGNDNYDIENWNADAEIGYTGNSLSVALGGSKFYNPYYENRILFIALRKRF